MAMTTVIATTQIEIEALLSDATACCWYLAANESERGSGYNREGANRLEPHMYTDVKMTATDSKVKNSTRQVKAPVCRLRAWG